MTERSRRHHFIPALGAASLLSLLALAPPAIAQAERLWIDPPADLGAPTTSPRPDKTSPPAPPDTQRSSPDEMPPPQIEDAAAKPPEAAPRGPEEAAAANAEPSVEKSGAKPESVTLPRKTRQQAAPAAQRKKQVTVRATTRHAQTGRVNGQKFRTVQDAVNSGLVVMNLRTIELPDGRRVTVLVRPDPRTLTNVMQRPYP